MLWLACMDHLASEKLGELPGHCHQWWSFPNDCQGRVDCREHRLKRPEWTFDNPKNCQARTVMFDVCGVVFGKRGVTERNDDLFLKIFEDHVNQHQTLENTKIFSCTPFSEYKRCRTLFTYFTNVFVYRSLIYSIHQSFIDLPKTNEGSDKMPLF